MERGAQTRNGGFVKYSVVIPLKNESANLLPLVAEIEAVMDEQKRPWELILVDDGSTDDTPLLIRQLAKTKNYVRPLLFDRNYGQSSAFDAGFKKARGEVIITLDGDGQNDPQDIPALLKVLEEGADMVVGWRVNRKDTISKRLVSKGSNYIRSRLCQDDVQDTGCSLKVYRKEALNKIKLFHGLHRFLPALFVAAGLSVKQVPVNHRPRLHGKSNYHFFNRSIGPLLDLFAVVWMNKRHLRYRIKDEL